MKCCPCSCESESSGNLFTWLFKIVALYIVLVFTGGTLINTGHPVAVEVGQLLHVITFVDPAINWAQTEEWTLLSQGLKSVSNGLPI